MGVPAVAPAGRVSMMHDERTAHGAAIVLGQICPIEDACGAWRCEPLSVDRCGLGCCAFVRKVLSSSMLVGGNMSFPTVSPVSGVALVRNMNRAQGTHVIVWETVQVNGGRHCRVRLLRRTHANKTFISFDSVLQVRWWCSIGDSLTSASRKYKDKQKKGIQNDEKYHRQ
jgi:hypothetical protein